MKKKIGILLLLLAVVVLAVVFGFSNDKKASVPEDAVIVFDTDAGTDDAVAFWMLSQMGITPDYIVATGGNASADGALRNCIILEKYLGMESTLVRGYETEMSSEKNTFHGEDGFANISEEMIEKLNIADSDITEDLTLDEFKKTLEDEDNIIYISVGPVCTLSSVLEDEDVDGIEHIYLMGGGLEEFNCSHDTEFNFSKYPEGVYNVLSSGMDVTLFTLDLTNHQRVTQEQIDELAETGSYPEYITLMEYNLKANTEYNKIDAAVIHDAMPVLYLGYPDEFTIETKTISCDKYGHIEEDENGFEVHYASSVSDDLLWNKLKEGFGLK